MVMLDEPTERQSTLVCPQLASPTKVLSATVRRCRCKTEKKYCNGHRLKYTSLYIILPSVNLIAQNNSILFQRLVSHMSHAKSPGSCTKIHATRTLAMFDKHGKKIEQVCGRCGCTAAASDFSNAIRIEMIEVVSVACRLTRSARRSSWQKSLSCWGCVSSPGQEITN